jgi:hypothetical protein
MLAAILAALVPAFQSVVASIFPNPEDKLKAQELQNQLQLAVIAQAGALEQAAAENVKAEISSGSWLGKNWRPILMLTFAGLIVSRWFGYSAPNMSEAEVLELWGIVKLGITGYVGGRTVEKVAPVIAQAFKK